MLNILDHFKMIFFIKSHAWIFTTAGLIGVIANIAQLVISCRDKNRKISAFGLVLLSLNIADLLASVAICLLGTLYFMIRFMVIDLALFKSLKQVVNVGIAFSLASSFTHVAFIASQRVIAVAFPFKVKQIFTKSRSCIVLALLWVVSIALAGIVSKFGFKSLAGISITVGIALMIFYSVVGYKTMRQNIINSANEDSQRRRRQSEREVLVYSMAVTFVFIICNYPKSLNEFFRYPSYLHLTGDFLYSVNPLLDTLLYFMSNYCRRKRQRQRQIELALQTLASTVGTQ